MKAAILDAPARPAVTSTVGALSDRELLRHTSTLVRHERHLQGAVIDHLSEIDARRLYLQRGCSSLFDYAVRELGYSDPAAARRIGAVRLCADQPDARERLRDGSLTLSAAAELQWAFDRQRRREAISGIASSATARATPAGSAAENAPATGEPPTDSAPAAAPSASDPAPPLVLDAAGRRTLLQEATSKSTRQVRRMLADLDPELAVPADRMRPLGDGRYELKAAIDADCQQGLEQLRGLLSHVDPRMTIGQVVGRIVQEALDRHDPSRPPRRARTGNRPAAGDSTPAAAAKNHAAPEPGHAVTVQDEVMPAGAVTPAPEGAPQPTPSSKPAPNRQPATERRAAAGRKPAGAATATAKPRASGRAIPAAVRRQVWQRDGGRCSYVDRETGRRCNSRHLIEMDHILPYALGGNSDPGNVRLLCGVHHRHRHAAEPRGATDPRRSGGRDARRPPPGCRAAP